MAVTNDKVCWSSRRHWQMCSIISSDSTDQPDETAQRSDAAMSDLKGTSGSYFEGMKPRSPHNAAASASTALATCARPPIRPEVVTHHCSVQAELTHLPVQYLISRKLSERAGNGSGG